MDVKFQVLYGYFLIVVGEKMYMRHAKSVEVRKELEDGNDYQFYDKFGPYFNFTLVQSPMNAKDANGDRFEDKTTFEEFLFTNTGV